MKRLIIIITALLFGLQAHAQHAAERVYVSTDRDWYAAGETLYLSAFCVDVRDGVRLSPVSAMAYVELASAEGFALGGKLALVDGRGAGSLVLPRTLPSGNYRLSAYTRISPACASKTISVYNTLSQARVPEGVDVGHLRESSAFPAASDFIQAATLPDGRIQLTSRTGVSLSVAVFRDEPFPSYGTVPMAEALAMTAGGAPEKAIPEYDGEILTLRLLETDGSPMTGDDGREILVSHPGHPEDLYPATLLPDGSAQVFTANIFGSGDLVVTLDENAPAFRATVDSPFRKLSPGGIPPLVLDPSLSAPLSRMSVRMQVTSDFDADTLYLHLPTRRLRYLPEQGIHYALDDYTRFATLQEVLQEYLSDIRARRQGDDWVLQIRCRERENGPLSFWESPSLILVDGVPVLSHSLVYSMDPLLVKSVDVYPRFFALGGTVYAGIANFSTYKGDMGGLRFGDQVRVLAFEGPSLPVAFAPSPSPRYPNERETLLWQPLVELSDGETLTLPSIKVEEGCVLVVEGITETGSPVYYRQQL